MRIDSKHRDLILMRSIQMFLEIKLLLVARSASKIAEE